MQIQTLRVKPILLCHQLLTCFTFSYLLLLGSTIFLKIYVYPSNDIKYDCTGRYFLFNVTVGACSPGGVRYQTVAGTTISFPSLTPTVVPPSSPTASRKYYIQARYSDVTCTSIVYAKALLLDSCDISPENKYVMYMATASTFSTTLYSDSTCKTVLSTSLVNYKSTCTDSSLSFLSPNGVPSSVVDIISRRLELVAFLSYSDISFWTDLLSFFCVDPAMHHHIKKRRNSLYK